MKKARWLLVAVMIIVTAITFIACNKIGNANFKVSFEVDGKAYYEISTKGEEELKMPDDPKKENYVFDGWYWDKDTWLRPFTAKSLLQEKLTANMTVYAKWIEEELKNKKFEIIFNSMGGSSVAGQTVQYEHLVTEPQEEPTKADMLFAGWFKEPDYRNEWSFATDLVKGETTLYAKWVADIPENRKYTVAFNSNGGSKVESYVKLAYKSHIAPPEIPEKEGFAFVGWYFDNTFAKEWNYDLDEVTDNITLYARWVDNADAKGCSILSATGFEIDGLTLSIVVPNSKNSMNLTELITVSPWATWEVYSDKQGINKIKLKSVSLKEGDNVFYVFVKSGMGPGTYENLYTLNIRRREIYNVTFVYNNGEPNDVVSFEEDSLITIEEDKEIAKVGYTFKEWQYNEEIWDLEQNKITKEIGHMTLEAMWTANEYEVQFNSMGGSAVEQKTVTFDKEFSFGVPTKEGYTFGGWKTAEGTILTNKDGESIEKWVIAENSTVFAIWDIVQYSITYRNVENAKNENKTTFTVEDESVSLSSAEKAGYTFEGWFSDASLTQRVTELDTSIARDIEIFAKWDIVKYIATFVADGTTIDTKQFTVESVAIEEPTIPEKVGYSSKWENYKIIPQNITINAVYTPIVYDVEYKNVVGSFDIDEPVNENARTYTIEDPTILLKNIEKSGYIFEGWFDGENKVTEIAAGSYGKKTFTAKWTAIKYSLSFIWDDAIGGYKEGESNPSEYTIEDTIVFKVLENKTPGYISRGWYNAKNEGTGEKVNGINAKTIGNKVFYAHWGLEEYTITYHNVEGVNNTNATTYTVQSDDIDIAVVTKVGYSFDGWYSDGAFTQVAADKILKGSTGNLDYYAKWTPIEYVITYNLFGGSYVGEGNPGNYNIEQEITLKTPEREGYVFGGWYTLSEGGERVEVIEKGTTGNIDLYARWIHISTITFETNGGHPISSITKTAGEALSAPINPTKDYYDFVEWYKDDALTIPYEFTVMPEEDITVYAKWTPTVYTITYVLNDGENDETNPDTYTVETETIVLKDASKTGYTFIKWFDSAEYTNVVTEIVKGSHGNIVLYSNYKINQYTITFESNGGTSVEPITQNYATAVSEPSAPAKNGYIFDGWYSDEALENKYVFNTIPAEDITIYARWELARYEIKYHLAGGTNDEENPSEYTILSENITFKQPKRDGYEFRGWFADSGLSIGITGIATGSFGDKEAFAKWEVIVYKATYIVPEGTINTNIVEFTVETDITMLANATLKGHSFDGWFSDEDYINPVTRIAGGRIGDMTIYGKFTALTYNVWMDGNEEAEYEVSFNLNGASGSVDSQTINETTTLVYPVIPERSGFLFAGWYDNAECAGKLFDFTAQVKKDIVLYAKWIECDVAQSIAVGSKKEITLQGQNEVRITFVPIVSGNVTIRSIGGIDTYGKLYNDQGVLISQDDDGASDDLNFLMVYNVTAGKAYTVVLRGFGSSVSGKVELSVMGGTIVSAGGYVVTATKAQATFGQNFSLAVPDAIEGYKFLGYEDADGMRYTDEKGQSIKTWDKDVDSVLYSVWERTVYTVTFNTQGGASVDDATLAFGDRLDLNDYVTTKNGYSFVGWYLNTSDTEVYDASTMPDHNITLYAKWKTFALGTIKYNEAKKAVSINDEITPELFDAICLDTNGNLADFTATISGTQTAGDTITIRLTAKSGNKTKLVTITDVKVYDNPTVNVTENKDYLNLSDGLNGEWFGASGTDTFGEASKIVVRIDGEYVAGDTVTVYIDSVDPAGNVTTQSVDNVKLYGLPVITYNAEKTAISVNDTISAELFDAVAKDSFNETVDISTNIDDLSIYNYTTKTSYDYEYFTAPSTGTYKLYYKNANSSGRTYIYVYCVTTDTVIESNNYCTNYSNYNYSSFSVTRGYKYYVRTYAYSSSYTTEFSMYVEDELSNKVLFAGRMGLAVLKATDSKGNITTIDIVCKTYDLPVFTEASNTEFRVEDNITPESLRITATDTFEEALSISLTIKSGTQTSGATMVYTASVTDVAGNVATQDIAVKIYGTPTITVERTDIKSTENPAAPASVVVSFDLNGGSGTVDTQTVTDEIGLKYPTTIPTKSGYVFGGWYDNSSCIGSAYDFSVGISNNTTLYAKWVSYSGAGVIDYNGNKTVNVVSKSSSTVYYYAFIPLVSGSVSVYSAGGISDTYGYLYDASKKQLITDDDSGDGSNFKITYTVTAGTLYYVRPCGYSSNGSTTVYVSGAKPSDGGLFEFDGKNTVLRASAVDSFGNNLKVDISLKSGSLIAGTMPVYTLTAADKLGNVCTRDVTVKVYDVNDIQLAYMGGASDLIKLTSKGEEFSAQATDSFGNECMLSIEAVDGYTFAGGNVISLYIVATDAAGNVKKSEIISNIKVYDMPIATLTDPSKGYTVHATDDLAFLFTVHDSFGEELYSSIEAETTLVEGEFVYITLESSDDAGNILVERYKFYVMPIEDENIYIELYVGDNLYSNLIYDNSMTVLPIPTDQDINFFGWVYNEEFYTDCDGKIVKDINQNVKLNAYCTINKLTSEYKMIYTLAQLKTINLDGKYVIMNDLDNNNAMWTPIGSKDQPFTGVLDGNGHLIKNIKFEVSYSAVTAGVFAGNAGTIRNIGLQNVNCSYSTSNCKEDEYVVGGLVAFNTGSIEKCFIESGTLYISMSYSRSGDWISGGSYTCKVKIGGLVGENGGVISNCYSSILVGAYTSVTCNSDYASYNANTNPYDSYYAYVSAGGLVASNQKTGIVENCFASGDVNAGAGASVSGPRRGGSASAYIGGLIGNNVGTINNSVAYGNIKSYKTTSTESSNNVNIGGVVGVNSGSIANCYIPNEQEITLTSAPTSFVAPTNGIGVKQLLDDMKTAKFIFDILNWEKDKWDVTSGEYPKLCWEN